jgi:hypothetical protein
VHNSPRTKHYPRARPDLTFRPVEGHFTLTDRAAVARELPQAGDDVRDRVTALLAQFVSQGMVR